MQCRFCKRKTDHTLINLGNTPIANAFLNSSQLNQMEPTFPLKVVVCDNCFLVQIDEFTSKTEIFSDTYVYFSSVSSSWLEHCKNYVEKITSLLNLGSESLVIEIASNDGYLLQYFKDKNIPNIGIEPTISTAQLAQQKGIETIVEFFDESLATKLENDGKKADLIIANNVLAHVPDLNKFVRGLKIALKLNGVITMEFPHLMKLLENSEFDTIYHEHYSYFSFQVINKIFDFNGFEIFDVEELNTHGGSLRVYAKHRGNQERSVSDRVGNLLVREAEANMLKLKYYQGFQEKATKIKNEFLSFLLNEKAKGKRIAAFGAAAKGNTFLNFAGIKSDLIEFVVDDTPIKQGKFLPGSHIPVVSQEFFMKTKPDIIVILPWNFKNEIMQKLKFTKAWGAQLVTYIPKLEIE